MRDIPLTELERTVRRKDTLNDVIDALEEHPGWGLVTVVLDDGSLEKVLEEGAIWRLVSAEAKAGMTYDAIPKKTVKELLEADELRRFKDRCVRATVDSSTGDVYDAMQDEGVLLAVISDEEGRPTHFFTTSDVRSVLLRDL